MKNNKDIKHVWSILCESSTVDQQSNNVSIHKVLEQLNVDLTKINKELYDKKTLINNPAQIIFPFQIVSMWQSINPKKIPAADVEIELFDFIGQSLQKINFRLTFEKDKTRMRTIIGSQAIIVTGTGVYLFKIKIKECGESVFTEVGEIPLEVRVNK